MSTEKEDDDYRPYDTLKAIGFTKDEAKGFLSNIEENAAAQLPPEPKKAPDVEVRFHEQKTQVRRSQARNILLTIGVYAFAIWLYVIAIQFFHPEWMYLPFATWLPIRMDYVGETAFFVSFILVIAVITWNTKRNIYHPRQEKDAST